jgi:uncharacterized protein YecE (DUF72 family)
MIWVGTSGYNYPEWRGSFYPEKLPVAKMLEFYATRLSSVEINYTFYRMPNERTLAGWVAATPARFLFTLKAPRRITHDMKLRDCGPIVRSFAEIADVLGDKLGVFLFQLPPSFRKDLAVLRDFLTVLPPAARAAFEFRHSSWHDEAVFEALKERGLALCIADSERLSTPVVATAGYGYFRLRDQGYTPADIVRWARTIEAHRPAWREVFVYFKHEERGKGAAFAIELMRALGQPLEPAAG